jgi:hypothetical protein
MILQILYFGLIIYILLKFITEVSTSGIHHIHHDDDDY